MEWIIRNFQVRGNTREEGALILYLPEFDENPGKVFIKKKFLKILKKIK